MAQCFTVQPISVVVSDLLILKRYNNVIVVSLFCNLFGVIWSFPPGAGNQRRHAERDTMPINQRPIPSQPSSPPVSGGLPQRFAAVPAAQQGRNPAREALARLQASRQQTDL
jgi:hypothetical protein